MKSVGVRLSWTSESLDEATELFVGEATLVSFPSAWVLGVLGVGSEASGLAPRGVCLEALRGRSGNRPMDWKSFAASLVRGLTSLFSASSDLLQMIASDGSCFLTISSGCCVPSAWK